MARVVGASQGLNAPLDKPGQNHPNQQTHRQAVLRNPDAFWATKHGKTRVELDEFHKYPRFKRLLGLIGNS